MNDLCDEKGELKTGEQLWTMKKFFGHYVGISKWIK
jgi:hypothetical protein